MVRIKRCGRLDEGSIPSQGMFFSPHTLKQMDLFFLIKRFGSLSPHYIHNAKKKKRSFLSKHSKNIFLRLVLEQVFAVVPGMIEHSLQNWVH